MASWFRKFSWQRELSPSAQPFLLLCRTTAKGEALSILGLLALVILSRFEALAKLSTHVIGGGERDGGLYLWLIEFHHQWSSSVAWFNTHAFFPYTTSLAWSDNFILPALIAAPFLSLGAPLVLVYNCLLLLAQFLNGYITGRLCFALSGNRTAAFLSGGAFLLCPAITAHLGHPQLQFAFFLPLGLFLFFRLVALPTFARGILLSLCIGGAFLTTVYYAVFLALLLSLSTLFLFLLRPRPMASRLQLAPLCGFMAGLLPLIPFVRPYLAVQETFGERFLHEPYFFSATALSYFSASPHNLFLGPTASFSHSEAQLYGSVALLALAIAGWILAFKTKHLLHQAVTLLLSIFVTALFSVPSLFSISPIASDFLCAVGTWLTFASLLWFLYSLGRLEIISGVSHLTNRALIGLLGGLAITLFLISLGPRGYSEAGPAIGLYRLFYELLPGVSAARAIGRLGIVVLLLIAISAGLGAAFIQRKYSLPTTLAFLVFAIAGAEGSFKAYPLEELPAPPTIFGMAAERVHSDDAFVVLPFSGPLTNTRQVSSWSDFARLHVNAMRWSLPVPGQLINGYTGQRTKLMREWPAILSSFPSAEASRALSEIAGLRFIIVLKRFMSEASLAAMEERLGSFQSSLKIVARDDEGNLLLEFSPSRVLDTDGAQLLVPRYPRGVLTLELSLLPVKGSPEIRVNVVDRDGNQEPILGELSLPADGSWQRRSFVLGASSYAVSPLRLGFKVEGRNANARTLYLRRSWYELAE